MKTITKELRKDVTLIIGLGLIVLSMGLFLLPELFAMGESDFGIFILNYLISIAFFIIVWRRENKEFNIFVFLQKVEYGFIHLVLCLISAYSLNREIPVFEQSTHWLQVFLVVQGAFFLLVFVKKLFPAWLQYIFWGGMGISFTFFLYLSTYLFPIYPIGLLAFPALGLSLHAFVPMGFVLTTLFYLLRRDNRNFRNVAGFGSGILLCIVFVSFYLMQWKQTNNIIIRASDKSLMDERSDLPEWTTIAQNLPKSALSEKILKTGLVYSVAPEQGRWSFLNLPNRNFDEIKKHDPLVMIATFFQGNPNLTTEQKIKILESMYDSRHQAQERLWSGDALQTEHVVTNIRLYPNLRIGYTEKIITVHNTLPKQTWNKQKEAIYTFHLPEGGVVTSLSLWIKGKEEKAILTSKHQADTAYKTIVGAERRDPSLVRWQEGNTVSVRVFPCSPDEDRRFKIGFTAPMRKESNKLTYDNIWFDGPATQQATESVKIHTMDNVVNSQVPDRFKQENDNTWVYEGPYRADWNLQIPIVAIQPNAFTFEDKTYQISEYHKKYQDFDVRNIYLDINNQWTKTEFENIRQITRSQNVYVYQNQRIKVTEENATKLFDQLVQLNFSIFPIYEIADAKNSLLISKGTASSPNISDLEGSDFLSKLKNYTTQNGSIKLFNLTPELSPYLKTLRELRVFDYDFGKESDLAKIIVDRKFVCNQEDSSTVIIHDAGIKITETAHSSVQTNAPDHLMRLFAYNNVLYRIGANYFDKSFSDAFIVDKAYRAYVVSPVTSLIVLETREDYKRFDIKDDGNSLRNASLKSSGSVPEPHEWLLIIVLAGVMGVLFMKSRKADTCK
jgi:XrtN system VIT domain protein